MDTPAFHSGRMVPVSVSFTRDAYLHTMHSFVKAVVTDGMYLSEAAKRISLCQHFWTVFTASPG